LAELPRRTEPHTPNPPATSHHSPTCPVEPSPTDCYARVLAAAEVSAEARARLQILHVTLNPFQLARDIERQKKAIEARRRLPA